LANITQYSFAERGPRARWPPLAASVGGTSQQRATRGTVIPNPLVGAANRVSITGEAALFLEGSIEI
jgi:hypothetical protein